MSFDITDIGDDVLDSRDIEERIDELESDKNGLVQAVEDAQEALDTAQSAYDDADADEMSDDEYRALEQAVVDAENALAAARADLDDWEDEDEYNKLVDFRDDVGSSEWTYGLTLIRDSYWIEYVQEMLEDCGEIPRDLPSYIVIDWEATAKNVDYDYSEADIEGVTYKFRNC